MGSDAVSTKYLSWDILDFLHTNKVKNGIVTFFMGKIHILLSKNGEKSSLERNNTFSYLIYQDFCY